MVQLLPLTSSKGSPLIGVEAQCTLLVFVGNPGPGPIFEYWLLPCIVTWKGLSFPGKNSTANCNRGVRFGCSWSRVIYIKLIGQPGTHRCRWTHTVIALRFTRVHNCDLSTLFKSNFHTVYLPSKYVRRDHRHRFESGNSQVLFTVQVWLAQLCCRFAWPATSGLIQLFALVEMRLHHEVSAVNICGITPNSAT